MERTAGAAIQREEATSRALGWVELLASQVGPRRPTSRAERAAAELVRGELARVGVHAELEPFDGYSTFFEVYAPMLAAAAAPALLPRRLRRTRALLGLAAAVGLACEGGLVHTPVSDLRARRRSQNLVAAIEPRADVRRTLCLVAHLDSSRSGLMFHPALVRHVERWIKLQSLAVVAGAAAPMLERFAGGRAVAGAARTIAAAGLALLVERELCGEDVPGASDNASGVAVAMQLAGEVAADPLWHTRLVLLLTGCEESGLLGAQAFLRSRIEAEDLSSWLFVNLDSVGGPGTLRYLRREGVIRMWDADRGLVRLAADVARRRPDLALRPTDRPAGLTYDTTPALARGLRAVTLSVQDETIPNLHWPTDTYENVDPAALERTLEAARELIAGIDRGAADR